MQNNKLELTIEIDLSGLAETINTATDLNDNDAVFAALASYEQPKKLLKDALDKITTIEAVAKGIINERARTLYGEKWDAIKGHGYKISRQPTGAVFTIVGKARREFIEVKETVKTKEVENYIKLKEKLPAGIEFNKNRGDSIRVTLK